MRQARIRDGHSSGTPVTRRLQQPTRTARSDTIPKRSALARKAFAPSLFGLAPGGVCRAAGVTAGAVRSYRTVSPLPTPSREGGAGGLFSVALSLGSRPPDVIRHRLSTEPGLSSPTPSEKGTGAAVRPTDAGRDGGSRRRRQGPDAVKGPMPSRARCRQGPMTRRSKVMVRARAAMFNSSGKVTGTATVGKSCPDETWTRQGGRAWVLPLPPCRKRLFRLRRFRRPACSIALCCFVSRVQGSPSAGPVWIRARPWVRSGTLGFHCGRERR